MTLRVFNTLSRSKEEFVPVHADPKGTGHVGMYVCGPTVYSYSHMGHLVGPLVFDAIKRYLTYLGYNVKFVVNITDVDDKILDKAKAEGIDFKAVAKRVEDDYVACMKAFDVQIDEYPHATEYIDEMQRLIGGLIDKGFAYAAAGDVYFDVTKDPGYGKLSNRKLDELLAGVRKEVSDIKRGPADFALWKAAKPGEPYWDSPWGRGRPGWHIECSAMAMKLLGETFDFHGGGLDLCFPHHEDEIAQSECFTGKPFAKYWLHNGLLRRSDAAGKLGGRTERSNESAKPPADELDIEAQIALKESKSKGRVFEIREMLKKYPAEVIRYFILATHYRRPIDFGMDRIDDAQKALARLHEFAVRFERATGQSFYTLETSATREAGDQRIGTSKANVKSGVALADDFLPTVIALRTRFLDHMDDDFNTGGAIGVLFELVPRLNKFIDEHQLDSPAASSDRKNELLLAAGILRELTSLLHILKAPLAKSADDVGGESSKLVERLMQLVIDIRADARKSKNFAVSDKVRTTLTDIGIALEDHRDGTTTWKKA